MSKEVDKIPKATRGKKIVKFRAEQAPQEEFCLNELLMDDLPHPAMLIRKDKTVLAANHIARKVGAKVGGYCWRDFGQSNFIPEEDKKYINDHKKIPPGGTCCYFCLVDEAFKKQKPTSNPKINAWGKIWDTHWVPLNDQIYLHYAVDITEHTQAQEALKESEERFRNLMEHIPGISVQGYDIRGTVFYWNKASEKVYGYSAQEAIGRNLGDLIIPADVKPHFERALEIGRTVEASGEFMPSGELMLLHKEGHLVPVFSIHTAVKIKDREPLLFCIDVDLSERKETEEALRKSKEKLKAQYKNMPIPTYTWQRVDDDFVLVDYNDAAEVITKGGVAKFVGKKATEMYRDKPDILKDLSRCFTEKTLIRREMLYQYKTIEETKYLDVSYVFVPPDLVMVHTQDITKRKQSEQMLQKAHGQLEKRIEERTADLERINRELRNEINERRQMEEKVLEYQQRLHKLTSQLSLTKERERRHIAETLHDDAIPSLIFLKMKLNDLREFTSVPGLNKIADRVDEVVDDLIQRMRSLTFDLSSSVLYDLGLSAAINEWLIREIQEKHGISTNFEDNCQIKIFDEDLSAFLYRAVRELLANVVKHAQAQNVKGLHRAK